MNACGKSARRSLTAFSSIMFTCHAVLGFSGRTDHLSDAGKMGRVIPDDPSKTAVGDVTLVLFHFVIGLVGVVLKRASECRDILRLLFRELVGSPRWRRTICAATILSENNEGRADRPKLSITASDPG
jgi:hypothetical protein